jgi:hypothetical protein
MQNLNTGSEIRKNNQYQSKYSIKGDMKGTPGSIISSKIGMKQGKMMNLDISN